MVYRKHCSTLYFIHMRVPSGVSGWAWRVLVVSAGFSLVKTWEDKLAGETTSLSAMIKMMLMVVLIGEEGLIKSSNALGEDFSQLVQHFLVRRTKVGLCSA